MAVIQNASGTGKSLFIFNQVLVTNNNPVLVRYYLNPTLNVPGSVTVPLNIRTGSTLASLATCYLGASITSNGTLLMTLPASNYGTTFETLFIVDPGTTILLTGQQAGAGTTLTGFAIAWYEI